MNPKSALVSTDRALMLAAPAMARGLFAGDVRLACEAAPWQSGSGY